MSVDDGTPHSLDPAAVGGIGETWRTSFRAGSEAFPGVGLAEGAFRRAWERLEPFPCGPSRNPEGTPAAHAVASRPADFFLAAACDEGLAAAWAAFEHEYVPRLRSLLRRHGASESETSDLLGDLPGYLCQAPTDGRARTRLGTYEATGSLFSWLAVIVLRRLHAARRVGPAAAPIASDLDPATRRAVPDHAVLGEETVRRFEAALVPAWETLTPRERLAVLLRHRDGLPGREIARLLGVGPPRVSRLIESGLSRLRDAVRRQMPDTPPGTSTPDQSVWLALAEVLARHLATLAGPAHEQGEARDE